MKLNERSLVFYATCDSPADNAGFLFKRGERHTAYHRRWFVLKGNMLFYFEERESREPVGVIVLEGCTVELCDSAEEFAFAIRFSGTKSRTYVLAADSQAAMEAWVKALSRASFDYMRLVVRELEKNVSAPWGLMQTFLWFIFILLAQGLCDTPAGAVTAVVSHPTSSSFTKAVESLPSWICSPNLGARGTLCWAKWPHLHLTSQNWFRLFSYNKYRFRNSLLASFSFAHLARSGKQVLKHP
uniref:Sesquipedalian n=1 Tax=Meleagris gallopavo TaxID=9103 RepID=A0A803XNW9_MELGA